MLFKPFSCFFLDPTSRVTSGLIGFGPKFGVIDREKVNTVVRSMWTIEQSAFKKADHTAMLSKPCSPIDDG
jgi:hypothetical protein